MESTFPLFLEMLFKRMLLTNICIRSKLLCLFLPEWLRNTYIWPCIPTVNGCRLVGARSCKDNAVLPVWGQIRFICPYIIRIRYRLPGPLRLFYTVMAICSISCRIKHWIPWLFPGYVLIMTIATGWIIISRVPILKVLTIASLKTIKKIILYLVSLIINGDISVSIHCRRNVFGAIVEKKNSPFI